MILDFQFAHSTPKGCHGCRCYVIPSGFGLRRFKFYNPAIPSGLEGMTPKGSNDSRFSICIHSTPKGCHGCRCYVIASGFGLRRFKFYNPVIPSGLDYIVSSFSFFLKIFAFFAVKSLNYLRHQEPLGRFDHNQYIYTDSQPAIHGLRARWGLGSGRAMPC